MENRETADGESQREVTVAPGTAGSTQRWGLRFLVWVLRGMSSNRYAALVTLSSFVVYVRTLAPSIMWYDMGEFVLGAYTLGIGHNTGYPLYMMLGKLFTFMPVGNVAYRVNLMSAVFASLAVLFVFLVVRQITRKEMPSLVAAATVAFSSTFWAKALWAEAHSLNAFFMMAIVYLMLRWRNGRQGVFLYLAFFALGLGLGNHRLVLLMLPGMVLFALLAGREAVGSLKWRPLLMVSLVLLLGFSVHLYLPLRAMQDPLVKAEDPGSMPGFVNMVFLGNNQPGAYDFSLEGIWNRRSTLWAFPQYDFSIPGLALVLVGMVWLGRRDRPLLVLTLVPALLTAFVILTFLIHDVYDYFIPIYLMFGVWLGMGVHQAYLMIDRMIAKVVGARVRVLTLRTRALALYAVFFMLPLVLFLGNFRLLDRSGDYDAYDFGKNVLSGLPQKSVVVADWWTYYPLLYQQVVSGWRRDVELTNILSAPDEDPTALIESKLSEGRRVYVAEGLKTRTFGLSQTYTLVLVSLHAITSPVTNYLPRPEYKDHLVVRREVYEVLKEKPSLVVSSVAGGLDKAISFDGRVSLLGLELSAGEVARGGSLSVGYTWELASETDEDFYARLLFVDAQGRARLKQGFPLWFQAFELGAGVYPTSEWELGQKVGYSFQTLVPRQVKQGVYYLQLRVYESKATATELVSSIESDGGGVVVGQIQVVD